MNPSTSSSEYLAPYHRLLSDQNKRSDIVFFRQGHTLEKHRAAIGRADGRFRGEYQSYLLQRVMDEDELERVRRDPGVEKVVEVTREMEKAIRKEDRTLVTFPGAKIAPGYMVAFTDSSYTLKEHFERIGEEFDNVKEYPESGYFVDVPESKIEKILADQNVYLVLQNPYAEMC